MVVENTRAVAVVKPEDWMDAVEVQLNRVVGSAVAPAEGRMSAIVSVVTGDTPLLVTTMVYWVVPPLLMVVGLTVLLTDSDGFAFVVVLTVVAEHVRADERRRERYPSVATLAHPGTGRSWADGGATRARPARRSTPTPPASLIGRKPGDGGAERLR